MDYILWLYLQIIQFPVVCKLFNNQNISMKWEKLFQKGVRNNNGHWCILGRDFVLIVHFRVKLWIYVSHNAY